MERGDEIAYENESAFFQNPKGILNLDQRCPQDINSNLYFDARYKDITNSKFNLSLGKVWKENGVEAVKQKFKFYNKKAEIKAY